MANLTYPLCIVFGVLPSFVWLTYYLRKDVHPESNRMILKIFFYGMLAAFPAILLEMGFAKELTRLNVPPFLMSILGTFIGVALVEEGLKYLIVKGKVLRHPEFDEPIDTMLYMIIAALGFAALENILIMFSLGPVFLFKDIFLNSAFRFLGGTFLHTLCSATIGFFLAFSFYEVKNRGKLLALGLFIAVLLHGLYNFSIMELGGKLTFLIPVLILIGLAIFVTFGFQKLKKLKSICKIK